jgi:hypothetical protein
MRPDMRHHITHLNEPPGRVGVDVEVRDDGQICASLRIPHSHIPRKPHNRPPVALQSSRSVAIAVAVAAVAAAVACVGVFAVAEVSSRCRNWYLYCYCYCYCYCYWPWHNNNCQHCQHCQHKQQEVEQERALPVVIILHLAHVVNRRGHDQEAAEEVESAWRGGECDGDG